MKANEIFGAVVSVIVFTAGIGLITAALGWKVGMGVGLVVVAVVPVMRSKK